MSERLHYNPPRYAHMYARTSHNTSFQAVICFNWIFMVSVFLVRSLCQWRLDGRGRQPHRRWQGRPDHGRRKGHLLHHPRGSNSQLRDPHQPGQQRGNALCCQGEVRLPALLHIHPVAVPRWYAPQLSPHNTLATGLRGSRLPPAPHQSGERRPPGLQRGIRSQLHSYRPR